MFSVSGEISPKFEKLPCSCFYVAGVKGSIIYLFIFCLLPESLWVWNAQTITCTLYYTVVLNVILYYVCIIFIHFIYYASLYEFDFNIEFKMIKWETVYAFLFYIENWGSSLMI